jgi:hypothetical protein
LRKFAFLDQTTEKFASWERPAKISIFKPQMHDCAHEKTTLEHHGLENKCWGIDHQKVILLSTPCLFGRIGALLIMWVIGLWNGGFILMIIRWLIKKY